MSQSRRSSDSRLEDIVNRTGALSRLTTERRNYLKEYSEAHAELERLKESSAGAASIQKQERVVHDCEFMLKYSDSQFQLEFRELEDLLQNEDELIETEEYATAMAVVLEAKNLNE